MSHCRTIGKTSSEIRLYFAAPNVQFVSDISKNELACLGDGDINCQVNKRASYISGQTIYGDALLANIGYTRRDSELHIEDVNLCTYYRYILVEYFIIYYWLYDKSFSHQSSYSRRGWPHALFFLSYLHCLYHIHLSLVHFSDTLTCFWYLRILLGKFPDGNCKISRDAILAAELPSVYSRFSWKGLSPRDLLCSFCRNQRLSEPIFAVSRVSCDMLTSTASSEERGAPAKSVENQCTNDVKTDKENPDSLKCEVKICSRKQEILLEYSAADTWSKESDAIQNSALKVLIWFNNYFKQLNTKTDELYLPECPDGFKIHPNVFLQEFAMCLSVYGNAGCSDLEMCTAVGLISMDTPKKHLESTTSLTHIKGPDSGVFPSHGSLTCICYTASLVTKDKVKRYMLESHAEFEFEIGTGAVGNQLESCVTQLSVNQAACFVAELPPRDLILAAASEFSHDLSNVSRGGPPGLIICLSNLYSIRLQHMYIF